MPLMICPAPPAGRRPMPLGLLHGAFRRRVPFLNVASAAAGRRCRCPRGPARHEPPGYSSFFTSPSWYWVSSELIWNLERHPLCRRAFAQGVGVSLATSQVVFPRYSTGLRPCARCPRTSPAARRRGGAGLATAGFLGNRVSAFFQVVGPGIEALRGPLPPVGDHRLGRGSPRSWFQSSMVTLARHVGRVRVEVDG